MTTRNHGDDCRVTALCIDSYENAVPAGRFYNRQIPEGRQFRGITQFLQEMECLLEKAEAPKAFTAKRSFLPPVGSAADAAQTEAGKGKSATFLLRIRFRQNASWQGSLTWVEGKREQSFRSVLELILLIDNALSMAAAGS